MKKVLLIHGPNLNLTGMREPGIYGTDTLASINAEVVQKCERLGMDCSVFQSNSEGALIDRIHAAREDCDAIIMNAGAYTHYSYAIRDAIAAVRLPRGSYVQCPRTRGIPPQVGHRPGLRRRDRRLRQAELPARGRRGQVYHRLRGENT